VHPISLFGRHPLGSRTLIGLFGQGDLGQLHPVWTAKTLTLNPKTRSSQTQNPPQGGARRAHSIRRRRARTAQHSTMEVHDGHTQSRGDALAQRSAAQGQACVREGPVRCWSLELAIDPPNTGTGSHGHQTLNPRLNTGTGSHGRQTLNPNPKTQHWNRIPRPRDPKP
jgi:hypothetical protein